MLCPTFTWDNKKRTDCGTKKTLTMGRVRFTRTTLMGRSIELGWGWYPCLGTRSDPDRTIVVNVQISTHVFGVIRLVSTGLHDVSSTLYL